MLTALALCNNVTPVIEQNERDSKHEDLKLEEVPDIQPVDQEAARKSIIGGMKEP